MAQSTQAYRDGWSARTVGLDRRDNPYRTTTDLPNHIEWERGFVARGNFDMSYIHRRMFAA